MKLEKLISRCQIFFAIPSDGKKPSNVKNMVVKNTFLKTTDVNMTTPLSPNSTPHALSISKQNEVHCFDSFNYSFIAYSIGLLRRKM